MTFNFQLSNHVFYHEERHTCIIDLTHMYKFIDRSKYTLIVSHRQKEKSYR